MVPKRIQRKRTKGWKMPEGAVYVGRPTRWGNPYHLLEGQDRADAVLKYRVSLLSRGCVTWGPAYVSVEMIRSMLRGKDLACWCPLDLPCHADVLLEIANEGGQ